MKVNELKDKAKVDVLELKIIEKQEPRDVRGGSLKVCSLTGQDDTGKVTVTLWNEDIDKVNEGDTIIIKNGWAQEYQDAVQVSPGRFGTLEVKN
jgi:replication factor A1